MPTAWPEHDPLGDSAREPPRLPPSPAACSWCGVDNQRSDCIDGMVPTDEYIARCPNRSPLPGGTP